MFFGVLLCIANWLLATVYAGSSDDELGCPQEASLLQKKHRVFRHEQHHEQPKQIRYFYEAVPAKMLPNLVAPNPWKCSLLPHYDPRRPTCELSLHEAGLHPADMSKRGNSSYDHKGSVRMLFPIGALPCCPTPPFCSSQPCGNTTTNRSNHSVAAKKCTKRWPEENLAYMTNAAAWPIYHGWGGSYELDVNKHIDVLGRLLRAAGHTYTFDLVIDIGANSGYVTEKLTARQFAKDYILVEAYEGMKRMYKTRFGNETWKKMWFADQVPRINGSSGTAIPNFEFLNFAVSDHSGGKLDLCFNEQWSGMSNNTPCPIDRLAIDDAIPARLSRSFKSIFSAAQSAYIKIDVEGMDEMALRGMTKLLKERRGRSQDGKTRYLVDFLMFEWCPQFMDNVKTRDNITSQFDVKTVTSFLESLGFETFFIGPRYLPLSHGSWDDSFRDFSSNVENSAGGTNYRAFFEMLCPGPECPKHDKLSNVMAADIFAMRASHPLASEIKLALGSCKESRDFLQKESLLAHSWHTKPRISGL